MKNILSLILSVFLFFSVTGYSAVDLNSASKTELESLPGVGGKTADDIIAARPFKSIDDLKNVKGIGNAKFDKMKSLVSIGGGSAAPATAPAAAPASVTKVEAPSTPPAAASTVDNSKAKAPRTAVAKLAVGERVNLNSASQEQLEKLPGVGPAKAKAIIAARPFSTIEDVKKVKGIKDGIFNKIKENITVN